MTRATTFPLNALLFAPGGGNEDDAVDKGVTIVGHDVWIGLGATILSGVAIGHGAVIGAGAIVSKSVPPYAVVAGNPARIIRYRFGAESERRLIALAWWDSSDEELRNLQPWILGDVGSFLAQAERVHGSQEEDQLTRRLRGLAPHQLTPHRSEERGEDGRMASGPSAVS